MQFRKRPVIISAVRATSHQCIETLEGTMCADPGDWIISGVKGERYPCKPDIFELTYEPADDEAAIAWSEAYGEKARASG